MRWQLAEIPPRIRPDDIPAIDGKLFVRVHGDQDVSGEGIDEVLLKAELDVM